MLIIELFFRYAKINEKLLFLILFNLKFIILEHKYCKENPTLTSDEIIEYTKCQPKGPPAILQAYFLFSRSITTIRRNKVGIIYVQMI